MTNGGCAFAGKKTGHTMSKSLITIKPHCSMPKHRPIHPGEVLQADFLQPLGLSEYRLAKDIGVPPRRINEIVKGQRSITADTALRLACYFKWPAQVWLNLQSAYDRQIAEHELRRSLAAIKPCALC
jgi:antitoxin HigA-1